MLSYTAESQIYRNDKKTSRALVCVMFMFAFIVVPFLGYQPAHAAAPLKVVYGFDREFPPFSFEEAQGVPTGFDVELLQAILRDKPVKLILRPLSWDQVLVELSAGNISVTSGMAKTPQRELLYRFAERPTLPSRIMLFTKNHNRVGNVRLLRGQRVAVEKGSLQQRVLEGFGGLNIKLFNTKIDALKALYNDEVVAYGGPERTATYYINKLKLGGISTVGTPLNITDVFFAVNREQTALLKMMNDGMLEVMRNGEYDRIYRKWFVPELLPEERQELIKQAKQATINSYAPYSRVALGAAVLTHSGKIFTGCNVENPMLNLSQTALKTAVVKAVSDGDIGIRAIVSVDSDGRVLPPSASDRQFLYEFGRGILSVLEPEKGVYEERMLSELLPEPYVRRPEEF
ncbi:cytidine deaminase [Oleidesulfovibrio sp.]|uniref:cytidine deaminase n=1 Tax=Oleidesulfovibrio sp. TaxID=2909707 RepID=UPI003A8645DD